MVLREGELKKRNEFRLNQKRHFVLSRDGQMKYYKNKAMHRGTIVLGPETTVAKTSKNTFEV